MSVGSHFRLPWTGLLLGGVKKPLFDANSNMVAFQLQPSVNGLTALSGGGQSGATPLTAMLNRVTTVAAAGDSVMLPPSIPGSEITVANAAAANSMNVFPQSGDAINALSANAAFAVAANKTAAFVCMVAGTWHAILSA